jgi:hypothetical protein
MEQHDTGSYLPPEPPLPRPASQEEEAEESQSQAIRKLLTALEAQIEALLQEVNRLRQQLRNS